MEWLKQARKVNGMSQTQIAKTIGISQQAYSNIESGRSKPTVDNAKKLAAILEVDWTRFYEK